MAMQSQFFAAINQIADEKGISKDKIIETIKAALRAAYRKDYGTKDQEIDVELDKNTGSATVYLVKEVVKKVEDEELQITEANARKYDKKAKVGKTIRIDVTPPDYGRIAAQSAKQVIIQRIQEAERDVMYEMFKDRENELVNALVHRVDGNNVYINLDNKITTVLPYDQQIPGEKYYGGQRLKLYLEKVVKTTKGPQLLISRTHPKLVEKLLELEIPEIKSNLVEVRGIARDPGVRCKVAVSSSDERIDPIGSCVGQKGVRVQNIMDELAGERIDIIQWSDRVEEYVKAALSPAKVVHIKVDERVKRALIYVNPDQRPLAIGKTGQNVRLASMLVGLELDILDISELEDKEAKKAAEKEAAKGAKVEDLKLNKKIIGKLATANLTLVEQLKGLSAKDLTEVEGISEEDAKKIVAALK
ncbi:MAG: transcription termination factor NusA [Patescibacteria group bacterium]